MHYVKVHYLALPYYWCSCLQWTRYQCWAAGCDLVRVRLSVTLILSFTQKCSNSNAYRVNSCLKYCCPESDRIMLI